MEFKNRIVMIGHGVVAQALLPLVLKHLRVPCAKIVVIDFEESLARRRAEIMDPKRACGSCTSA